MTNAEFIKNLKKSIDGNTKAMEIIYEEYFHKIFATALSIVKNYDDAYDIAMNVFVKLLNYSSVDNIDNHIGFLVVMTKNECLDLLRKKKRNVHSDLLDINEQTMYDTNLLWYYDILTVLTKEEEKIFVEHVIWGKKLKEISIEINIAYITVKRKYKIIKSKIKKIYQNDKNL